MKIISESRTVRTDCGVIDYELIYKEVKNINLRIKHDCTVHVSANPNVDKVYIDNFIKRKSGYIFKTLDVFSEQIKYQPSCKKYISGESIAYLGKNLRIKLIKDNKNSVSSDGVYLYLNAKNSDSTEEKGRCVNNWIKEKCNIIFDEIISEVYEKFSRYLSEKPRVAVRSMTSRWGSCQVKSNTITMNSRLIEVPRYCIEYVVTHEFVHFVHPNHSKQFYSFLSMIMPDWKERKQQLEKYFCWHY